MKFNRIAEKAKQALDRRGGMDALKEDLQEVKEAATGRGSFRDKARAAADALKTPGKNPDAAGAPADAARAPADPPPSPPSAPPAA